MSDIRPSIIRIVAEHIQIGKIDDSVKHLSWITSTFKIQIFFGLYVVAVVMWIMDCWSSTSQWLVLSFEQTCCVIRLARLQEFTVGIMELFCPMLIEQHMVYLLCFWVVILIIPPWVRQAIRLGLKSSASCIAVLKSSMTEESTSVLKNPHRYADS